MIDTDLVILYLSGGTTALCLVAALYFFRFWRRTRDRFFGIFGGAFLVLACHYVALSFFVTPQAEARPFFYVVRAAAFLLFILAIFDKNRGRS